MLMRSRPRPRALLPVIAFACAVVTGTAGAGESTVPPPGIRHNTPSVYALTNARIIAAPGDTIAEGVIVIRDGMIVALGAAVSAPADARVIDLEGKTLYPGFVDAYTEEGAKKPGSDKPSAANSVPEKPGTPVSLGAAYWNGNVTPQARVSDGYTPDTDRNQKLRSQGITARLAVPVAGVIKGTSALVTTGDTTANAAILAEDVALHARLQPPHGFGDRGYPNSPMGAVALFRQAFYDADWYNQAWRSYRKSRTLPRPERNDALAALQGYAGGSRPVVIDASNELYCLRADRIGREFDLNVIVRGSGMEYRRLDAIKATGRAVILPVNFPEAPDVKTPEAAMGVTLQDLMHWDIAPENPARLSRAGVRIALSSNGLKDVGGFLKAVRQAVSRGLDRDAALRALTVTPAELFGVDDRLGTLGVGKAADIVVTDGDIFDADTRIIATWVDGKRYEVEKQPLADVRGTWSVEFTEKPSTTDTLTLSLKGKPEKLSGTLARDSSVVKLERVDLNYLRLEFSLTGDSLGWPGVVRLSGTVSGDDILGTGVRPDGGRFRWTAKRTAPFTAEPDTSKADEKVAQKALYDVNYPLGAFGVPALPPQPKAVFFKNATVWTCGPDGVLEGASVLVRKGRIAAVGTDIAAPADAVVIDLTGKHLTPGIIDCHSHIATDGGINESGQTITAEVRIGDFIDCNQVAIYRQLAGGTTAANILHGSANTIGGQCQVIKLRWGALPEAMKFKAAAPDIKFALGENVKQSNWGDRFRTRYPQTRMGAEQIVRDEFKAARDYRKRWNRWRKKKRGIPPRRDLELDAIVEVLEGKRLIHCHAYRQDEILALIRTCEDFGVRVAAFQHVLEGYKVADAIAKHGAGGSTFSDWWAYKFEVYDAIPYNGALMRNAGVVVSFNSDDGELGTRLNLEAAKATKYGDVPAEEALKFVTINPAIQLHVADRVGSIAVGKDADLAIWSDPPMSTRTVCEQTWIDGRKYFDRAEDATRRAEVRTMREALIQRILKSGKSTGSKKSETKKGDHWPRFDLFGGHGDHRGEER